MKFSFLLFLIGLLTGAGCSTSISRLSRPPVPKKITWNSSSSFSATEPNVTTSTLCADAPQEDASGSLVYPIASPYQHLPHLGQIYTALDCKNMERVLNIQGMKKDEYAAGVRLRWSANTPPTGYAVSILEQLHFIQESPLIWSTTKPLSLNELQILRSIFDKTALEQRIQEDCIVCG